MGFQTNCKEKRYQMFQTEKVFLLQEGLHAIFTLKYFQIVVMKTVRCICGVRKMNLVHEKVISLLSSEWKKNDSNFI